MFICMFWVRQIHTYIYGWHITVHNDHKPLEMIQKKPIHATPPCLQRMLLHLEQYDYTIVYKCGKEMVLEDCLSQFPPRKEDMPIELHQNIHNIHFEPDRLNIIRGAVERDPIHSTIYRLTLNGWPDRVQDIPRIACHFWGTWDEFTVENGILLRGDRVCYMKGCSVIYMATAEGLRRWYTSPTLPNHCLLAWDRCWHCWLS